jgi:hypothetical protein
VVLEPWELGHDLTAGYLLYGHRTSFPLGGFHPLDFVVITAVCLSGAVEQVQQVVAPNLRVACFGRKNSHWLFHERLVFDQVAYSGGQHGRGVRALLAELKLLGKRYELTARHQRLPLLGVEPRLLFFEGPVRKFVTSNKMEGVAEAILDLLVQVSLAVSALALPELLDGVQLLIREGGGDVELFGQDDLRLLAPPLLIRLRWNDPIAQEVSFLTYEDVLERFYEGALASVGRAIEEHGVLLPFFPDEHDVDHGF